MPGQLRKNLKSSLVDAGAFSVMVGTGETYMAAFALALGMGEVVAGFITSVPFLLGSAFALITPWGVRRLGSHRKWVVLCAGLQAMSFIPFVVGAWVGSLPVPLLFLFASLYWASGQATGPAWNTWMEHLVPRRLRARFFASRTRFAQMCVLTGLLLGGFTLEAGRSHDAVLFGFALIFSVAAVCRMISARFLAEQSEDPPRLEDYRSVPLATLVKRMRHDKDGKLLVYLLCVQLSVHLASPFFSPFMLSKLGQSYGEYMVLLTVALMARIFALPLLGAMAHRFGTASLLWVGGVGIAPLAALWIPSQNYFYLVGAQLVSGAMWASYDLATQLVFFEAIRKEERTSLLSIFNVASAGAMVLGAGLGGLLLHQLGQGHHAYMVVFAVSSVLRGLTVILLLRVARVPQVVVSLAMRIVAVRPSSGVIARPILPSVEDAPKELEAKRREGDA